MLDYRLQILLYLSEYRYLHSDSNNLNGCNTITFHCLHTAPTYGNGIIIVRNLLKISMYFLQML